MLLSLTMMTTVGIYEFNAKDLIGHGALAVVYKGRLKLAPTDVVAIKAITKKIWAKVRISLVRRSRS